MDTSREPICIFFRTWIPVLIFLLLGNSAYADPLGRFAGDLPGSEPWWTPSGADPGFSESPSTDFTLTWSDAEVVRYKVDDELRCLLTSSGPLLGLDHTDRDSFIRLSWLGHDVEAHAGSGGEINTLSGDRSLLEFEAGFDFQLLNEDNLTVAASYYNFRLNADGLLPTLMSGIPGLDEDESSNLDWRENGWSIGVHYRRDRISFGILYGQSSNQMELESVSPVELVRLRVDPSGHTIGFTGEMPLDRQTIGEAFYWVTHSYGEDGVYRGEGDLGPFRAAMDSWTGGFRLKSAEDLPRWQLSFTRGIHRNTLSGSANISSFGEPVFGIVTPRVHLDLNIKVMLSTIIYERDTGEIADAKISCFLGATRWDLEGDVRTWESYLFGSAILNETITTLDAESGWLAHAGIRAGWELSDRDNLQLHIGQSVPVSIARSIEPSPPGPPGPPRRTVWDGGRYVSLSCTHIF